MHNGPINVGLSLHLTTHICHPHEGFCIRVSELVCSSVYVNVYVHEKEKNTTKRDEMIKKCP
jgi:hypothetical protein